VDSRITSYFSARRVDISKRKGSENGVDAKLPVSLARVAALARNGDYELAETGRP